MKISIITLGCKVNQYESNSIAKDLSLLGHEVSDKLEFADLYILNTCAVTGIAEKKSRAHIAKLTKLNSNAKIIVCGCASQNNSEQFLKHKNVSAVIGTSGKSKISQILNAVGNLTEEISATYETFTNSNTSKTRAYIKIQDGCNNFCSYCLIPYVRGRSRSRQLADILEEVKLVEENNKEIVLTGINISDYKIDGKLALPILMDSLKNSKCNVRIGSLEVNVITDELLAVLKNMPNFCPQFHLSMQSGCDRILKLMNRHYNSTEFLNKIELIRKYFPNASITTDVIVGFPTETDEDFAETIKTIQKAQFFEMHIFPYSVRNGTVASKLKLVDGNIINKRVKILEEINKSNKLNYIKENKNNILYVLTENIEGEYMVGHSTNFIKIYLPKETARHIYVQVKITEPYLDGAKAEVVKN